MIREDRAAFDRAFRALTWLASADLQVGLPASGSNRNRFILGIQERGCPVMNIPPRPVIAPALSRPDVQESMADAGAKAILAAADGDLPGAKAALESAGQAGADGIRAYIDSGVDPPNSPKTVSGGWIWNRVAGKPALVSGKGFDKPLYATGELYSAFNFELK